MTAIPVVLKSDETNPVITITTSPDPAATYLLNQVVDASYGCTDATSGISSANCVGTVANGSAIDIASVGSKSFTVNATDNAGKTATLTHNYNVTYNVCLLYDPTRAVMSGATYPLKMYLCDVNNSDVLNSAIIVQAASIFMVSDFTGAPRHSGNAKPDSDFRFDPTLGPSSGYIFRLRTKGLGSGTYGHKFTASGDPTTRSILPGFGLKQRRIGGARRLADPP